MSEEQKGDADGDKGMHLSHSSTPSFSHIYSKLLHHLTSEFPVTFILKLIESSFCLDNKQAACSLSLHLCYVICHLFGFCFEITALPFLMWKLFPNATMDASRFCFNICRGRRRGRRRGGEGGRDRFHYAWRFQTHQQDAV